MKQKKDFLRSLILCISLFGAIDTAFAQVPYFEVKTRYGNYAFSYNQVPEDLINVSNITGVPSQWQQSISPVASFADIPGATSPTYIFSAPLTQTSYFRRRIYVNGTYLYSNVLKLELVSVNWENLSYVREHNILIAGQTNWQTIDALQIGDKLQTTTYLDGLGRPIEKIAREMATHPNNPNSLWGDIVQFSRYDAFGRPEKAYLPYTTTTESGKYKTTTLMEHAQYYNNLNETSAYSSPTFDNSPLNRVLNVKRPGTSWAASPGNSVIYDMNDVAENVRMFTIGYASGAVPTCTGAYPSNTLYKITSTDEHDKQTIEYINKSGQSILTKVQLANKFQGLSLQHDGWICTYSVYDDFGLLRYRFQPEGVKWLDTHSWSFAGTDGTTVLNEWCFRYEYDIKGRPILKKAPGAEPLYMIYDKRDRVVFMQDGNQRLKNPPEWTVNIYDELDRHVITTLYRTTKTIANLQTDIDNAGNAGSVTITAQNVTVATYNNPITSSDLNNSSVTTIVKYNFYDNYSYTGAKAFNTSFDNGQAYPSGGDPIVATQRTTSMPTGAITRVLATSTFLISTVYYDEKGRSIQTTEDNIKSGTDVTTVQYQFDGRILSTNTKHTAANTGYTNFSTVTKNIFDKIGRVTSIEKKYGSNAFKPIANYDLDDMGRLKSKKLDPLYNANGGQGTIAGIETLDYSYNIHDEITGINKNYALKAAGYNKWSHYFGLYLGYDNLDNVFTAAQLDGHVTGTLWNTQGDDNQRKYDFTYDNAGRLTSALFKERKTPSTAWGNTGGMDFSVTGGGSTGKIEYDLNGNLLYMLQKGVLPGNTTAVTIDNLSYSYSSFSNKLMRVTDNNTLGATNGKFGDFVDGGNTFQDDYVYDDNGNLVIDLNKNVIDVSGSGAGIRYNFLDKPEEIQIPGKGTISIFYDADGNKLLRTFTAQGSGNTRITTYINEFVYQETVPVGTPIPPSGGGGALQYINFEEGRIRVMQSVSQNNGFDILTLDGNMDLPGNKRGAYDFYIRDYQGNVRMILTEETHFGSNSCTMEQGRAANEEPLFGQVDANGVPTAANEVAQRFPVSSIPGQSSGNGWTNTTIGSHVSRVGNLASSKMGPNTLLKVMAGDKISATTIYYYQNPVTNTSGSNTLLQSLLNSLLSAITGSPVTNGLVKNGAGNITSQLGNSGPFSNVTSPDAGSSATTFPKAYLTILFFDERFNFVEEGSAALRVQRQGNGQSPLVFDNIKAPKNGYCYVYVSNEANEMVYFDNLQVSHERGRIVEENHYYAYGLKITGISSKKLGDVNEGHLKNGYLYNDKELFDDADLNWYDYGFRNYDPQIGRFPQLDPLTDGYPELTPYQYASCEPIANIDLDGLEKQLVTVPGKMTATITSSTAVVTASTGIGANLGKVGTQAVTKTGIKASVTATTGGLNAAIHISQIAASHSEGSPIIRNLQQSADWSKTVNSPPTGRRLEKMIKDYVEDMEYEEHIDKMVEQGIWDRNLTREQARKNFINLNLGLALPNVIIKPAVVSVNAAKGVANFTKYNFRSNLIKATGLNPGKTSQAHHIFPQKFESFFSRSGINIHDPKFGSWWETSSHLKNASGYNAKWTEFILNNPNATQSQILNQGRSIMQQYGLPVGF